jgi:hypothetical protein
MNNVVFGWCYSRFDGWGYMLLYYKAALCCRKDSQVLSVTKVFKALSGFVHKWRGLHWHRGPKF